MSSIVCPLCHYTAEQFSPIGTSPSRRNGKCPQCMSYERHRLIWWYVCEQGLLTDGARVLDIAPMPALRKAMCERYALDYISVDLGARPADVKMDLENLAFADESYDAIFCMHVLEHVDNDRRAMKELHRVLRPGGWAVLMVPINENNPVTDEDPNVMDPLERERRFGQGDHVRLYGADYISRCESAGLRMQVVSIEKTDIIARHAFMLGEKIFLGWRD
jgi:SAM-dependent methyltransferase